MEKTVVGTVSREFFPTNFSAARNKSLGCFINSGKWALLSGSERAGRAAKICGRAAVVRKKLRWRLVKKQDGLKRVMVLAGKQSTTTQPSATSERTPDTRVLSPRAFPERSTWRTEGENQLNLYQRQLANGSEHSWPTLAKHHQYQQQPSQQQRKESGHQLERTPAHRSVYGSVTPNAVGSLKHVCVC